MIIRLHWGYRIMMLLGGFIVFMSYLVYVCIAQDDVHLVDEQYYKEDLAYQQRIDALENTFALAELPYMQIDRDRGLLEVSLPYEGVEQVSLHLFRPSDARLDKKLFFTTAHLQVPLSELVGGYWLIKLSWRMQGKEYYYEKNIHI